MINVKNVTKQFGSKTAVNDISFDLHKGEVMGFIGPNGAGKSTTMRMITGFIPATSGSIKIGNYDIDQNPIKAKSLIGYLPENAPLYSNKNVCEFLEYAAELRGFHGKEKYKKVDQAIETCFLETVKYQSIDTLSKGYRQRTCFAQSIIHDPEILIFDEPTDGLDPNQKDEVRKLIREMGKIKAIIISTHILEEVEAVTSRVLLISHGEKRFDGTPHEFTQYSNDANTFTLCVLDNKEASIIKEIDKIDSIHLTETVSSSENGVILKLHFKKGSDPEKVRAAVAETISRKKWKVSEFKKNEGKLNAVFAELTNKIA